MTEHFEARHRALRTSWLQHPARSRQTREELHAADRAEEQLQEFDQRTGPLVDDLVAAVREGASCENPQDGGPDPSRVGEYVQSFLPCGECWDCQLLACLAALDEASGRG